jgi:hypothetical protein
MSDISLLANQALVFADPPSEATVRRALAGLVTAMLGRIGKARAKVRARVWDLLERRPDGFPWQSLAGKVLPGWVSRPGRDPDHRPQRQAGCGGDIQTRIRVPPARRVVREHRGKLQMRPPATHPDPAQTPAEGQVVVGHNHIHRLWALRVPKMPSELVRRHDRIRGEVRRVGRVGGRLDVSAWRVR